MEDKIFHRAKTYMLEVNPEKQELQIALTLLSRRQKKVFKALLSNDHLPKEVQKNLRDISIVYELLLDQQGFKVDEEEGKIIFKTSIIINKKQIQTRTQLQLEEEEIISNQEVLGQIKLLKGQVGQLKKALEGKNNKEETNQNLLIILRKQMQREFLMMKKQFIKEYEVSDASQRQSQNEIDQLKEKIKYLQGQLQNTLTLNEKFKKHEALYFKDTDKILGRVQILQNKMTQIMEKDERYSHYRMLPPHLNMPHMVNVPQMGHKFNVPKNQLEQKKKINAKMNTGQKNPFIDLSIESQDSAELVKVKKAVIDFSNQYASLFKFNDRKIIYFGDDQEWTHILGKQTLKRKQTYEFVFKIMKSRFGNVNIGLCDKRTASKLRRPIQNESILISGDTGQIVCLKGQRISYFGGLKVNDTIKLKIDLVNNKIIFSVNDDSLNLGSKVQDFIKNQAVQIVPFICFYRKGDVVEWIK